MPDWIGYVLSAVGSSAATWGGIRVTARKDRKSAEHQLIDQLQEELREYRDFTNERIAKLEREYSATRRYLFAQIDHARAHGVEPLPWPDDLPR